MIYSLNARDGKCRGKNDKTSTIQIKWNKYSSNNLFTYHAQNIWSCILYFLYYKWNILFKKQPIYIYIFQEDNIKKHKETFLQDMDGDYVSHWEASKVSMRVYVLLPLVMMIAETPVLRKSTNATHRNSRSMTVRLCHTFRSNLLMPQSVSVRVHVSRECVRVRKGERETLVDISIKPVKD